MNRDSAPQLQELGVRGITGPGGKTMAIKAKGAKGMTKKKTSAANKSVPANPFVTQVQRPAGGTFADLPVKKGAQKKKVGY